MAEGDYLECQAIIEELVDRGKSLASVERAIDRFELAQDKKDALKTWAWAWRESHPRFGTGGKVVVAMVPQG